MTKAQAPLTLKAGREGEVVFYRNPKSDSPFRFRATHWDGRRAPKVILYDDARKLCRVRVIAIRKPAITATRCRSCSRPASASAAPAAGTIPPATPS